MHPDSKKYNSLRTVRIFMCLSMMKDMKTPEILSGREDVKKGYHDGDSLGQIHQCICGRFHGPVVVCFTSEKMVVRYNKSKTLHTYEVREKVLVRGLHTKVPQGKSSKSLSKEKQYHTDQQVDREDVLTERGGSEKGKQIEGINNKDTIKQNRTGTSEEEGKGEVGQQ
eukprot:TRINITY_DN7166_c0_g1_i2.p1 TRINITY_DN7166_c0_g1~~TRINITY_DN7166_c0_g1_i2.p1  ORF type:complete len:191 (+),score=25.98 TRINITY_DN7166_c0_g1_i2:70-573(+)